jgi:hypothetical protein
MHTDVFGFVHPEALDLDERVARFHRAGFCIREFKGLSIGFCSPAIEVPEATGVRVTQNIIKAELVNRLALLPDKTIQYVLERIKFLGLHSPPGEEDWDMCPLAVGGYGWCRQCTHIFMIIPITQEPLAFKDRNFPQRFAPMGPRASLKTLH